MDKTLTWVIVSSEVQKHTPLRWYVTNAELVDIAPEWVLVLR